MKLNLLIGRTLRDGGLLLLFLLLFLQSYSQNSNLPIRVNTDSIKWSPTKPPMAGAEISILEGDPKTAGHFTMRIKMPPHYKIPPHTHPVDERTTVISGSISVGSGEVMDTVNVKRITAGGFYLNPANTAHYSFTNDAETIVQISTNGPWGSVPVSK